MMISICRGVMAVTACAAGLSLAACSAGITTASQSPSASRPAPAPKAPAPPSPSPSASPAGQVKVDAPIRIFPVPPGAQVLQNMTCDKEILIQLGAVTVSQVSRFYNSVLPENGYKITSNTMITMSGNGSNSGPTAEIKFTGHGYKGAIEAATNLGSELRAAGIPTTSLPSSITGKLVMIDMIPPGAKGCGTATP
jgi:hypothetical protein